MLSALTDCALTQLLAFTAWKAMHRSHAFARAVWVSVFCFSLLQAVNCTIGVLVHLLTTPEKALNLFWPTTIMFYVVFLTMIPPLLLREDIEAPVIGLLQTLDVAQLGILTFSAYLVFFYIPLLSGTSDDLRTRHFLILHLMRDGFLAVGFFYRGWRSRSRELRGLHLRLSAFFAAFGITGGVAMRAMTIWHWPHPLASFTADVPPLFLLWIAAGWQQKEAPQLLQKAPQRQTRLWNQIFPLAIPLSVIALASRISGAHPHVAWASIVSSFVCYAARLHVMQRRQDATLSSLSAMEEKFSKAFHSSPVAISISRLSDGAYVDANHRYLELLGRSRDQVIGKTSVQIGVFASVEERSKVGERIRQQGFLRSVPFQLRAADRTLYTLVSAEVIKLEDEPLVISSVQDITELKNVTQQLQQAQKMELVGSLAGGVAHDFNNLLTIIKGYSELARMRELKGDLAEEIRQIGEAADRAAALTRQLLAFSRRQILQPRNIGLNSVLAGIEKLLRRTIGENIELVNFYASDLGTVHADPVQMEQVVVNLAINSRDAMPRGGQLVFQTKNVELSSPYGERGFEIPAGRYIVLTVTDTGTGIAPENLDRVFEPFFTTKEASQGTGLGLSTVYGIVKQSGGYISVHSELGLGTTFRIYLPRVDQVAESLMPADIETPSLDGTERILVVEDDQSVCELAASVLKQHGYNIMTATSAEDALRRVGEFKGVIDLLLTDIVMAGTNGYELAALLKEVQPGLKVLYMSGYPHFALSGPEPVDLQAILAKPFTPSELLRDARRVLDHQGDAAALELR